MFLSPPPSTLHPRPSTPRPSFLTPQPSTLQATFDNSASLITSVGVKCHVSLEPLRQLQARDAFRAREALMASMVGMSANLEAQAAAYQRLVEEEDALLEHKKELLSKLSSVTARIEAKSAEIDTSLEAASAMKAEIDEMAARLYAMKGEGEAKGE